VTGADVGPAELAHAPLGHPTRYPDAYAPALLCPVPRAPQRAALGIAGDLPFDGADVWTAYDLTWVDPRGRPQVAIATLEVPAGSPAIVESKSMKLYLGSFAQTRFDAAGDVTAAITHDVSAAAGAPVRVMLDRPGRFGAITLRELDGTDLDALDIGCSVYDVDPSLLETGAGDRIAETLRTDLFRSICPVTGQPDLGSVRIAYEGAPLDRSGLLRYLVSYRGHAGFHEHCVERIFMDIRARCAPERLTVEARFTRRGGLDINPFRTDAGAPVPANVRTARQ
jgi:7-cyano-7-deazaguanine reductase